MLGPFLGCGILLTFGFLQFTQAQESSAKPEAPTPKKINRRFRYRRIYRRVRGRRKPVQNQKQLRTFLPWPPLSQQMLPSQAASRNPALSSL